MADKYGRGSDLPTSLDERGRPTGGGPHMPGSKYKTPYEFNGDPDVNSRSNHADLPKESPPDRTVLPYGEDAWSQMKDKLKD